MEATGSSFWRRTSLILNCILLGAGNSGGQMLLRLYFVKGGTRIWLSSFLQSAGFPVMLIPLAIAYTCRRRRSTTARIFFMTPRIFLACVGIGILAGASNGFYSYGMAKLPVSTTALIIATQLAFTAVFAYFIVKQKFTAYSVNSVVLLTVGAAVLGLNTSGDRPEGETGKEYALGFVLTAAAAGLAGLVMPLLELTYAKAKLPVTYTLVVEIQMTMCAAATVLSAFGMLINKDFQAISGEAKQYQLGEFKYYLVLFWTCIVLQCFFLGLVGVIFYASSLLSGIIITISIPLTQVLAVVFYHEKFHAEKGFSLFLILWGFVSYSFGEMMMMVQNKNNNSADNQDFKEDNINPLPHINTNHL